jgi:hypothetical protein
MSIMIKLTYINFKNYEILKIISDRLNILSWALGGLYGYISIKINPIFGSLVITMVWLILQWCSLVFANIAQKYKKE